MKTINKPDLSIFDNPPIRSGSSSIKWDKNQSRFGRSDVIPLWIADMDFAVPEVITEALKNKLSHPVFGYNFRTSEYTSAIQNWLKKRFDWNLEKKHMLFYPPGTVAAINNLVNLFSSPGDEVIVHTPAYPPLMNIVLQNKRQLVKSSLVKVNNRFEIDWDSFEESFSEKTRILILCSPHNPTGRVWRKDELLRIANICKKHNTLVISDEVHADLTSPGEKHIHFNRLPQEERPKSITIISSCKTFNLAGLSQSTLICDHSDIAKKIQWSIDTSQLNLDNIMSATAAQAGYEKGEAWLDSLRDYVKSNRDYVIQFLEANLPQVTMCKAEGTYLAWLDFNQLQIEHHQLNKLFVEKAGVGLYDGQLFGDEGTGYFRINLACSKALLEEAMQKIQEALN